jgi:hypothetical protein
MRDSRRPRKPKRDGIGVDMFFGGGEPDFAGQAKKGRLVPLRVFETRPELFTEDGPIPETFTGERYYPAGSRVGGHLHVAVWNLLQSRRAPAPQTPGPHILAGSRRSGLCRQPGTGGPDQERIGRAHFRVVSPGRDPKRA